MTFQKFFPTASNDIIGVISIPSRLFGDYIHPNSFEFTSESGSIYDDGEGNIILSSSSEIMGNIFYSHGIITLTNPPTGSGGGYGVGLYGTAVYGGGEEDLQT